MTAVQLIRISDTTIALGKLHKIALEEKFNRVCIHVKDRAEPFTFHESSPEKATSLYIDICKLVQSTQQTFPFLFFANVAVRNELLSAIHVEGSSVVISTVGHAPDVFVFESEEKAKSTFNDLMFSLGVGGKEEQPAEDQIPAEPAIKKSPAKIRKLKTPDKVPRKSKRF